MGNGYGQVVIDSNFIGGGKYRSKTLRQLVERLDKRGHEVAVPEIVIWEWAEHLHQELREISFAIAPTYRTVERSGLPYQVTQVVVPDVEQIVADITSDLATMANVRVINVDPTEALEAVKHQVLQVGHGIKRHGVKTGAADALVAAAARECAEDLDVDDQLVMCTNDAGLGKLVEKMPGGPVVVRNQRDLWAWHGTTTPDDGTVAENLQDALLDRLTEWCSSKVGILDTDFPLFAAGIDGEGEIRRVQGLRTDDSYQLDIGVTAVEELSVEDVEVLDGEGVPRVVVATVKAVVLADLTNWFFDEDGKLLDQSDVAELSVEVLASADFSLDWQFLDYECSDAANVTVESEYGR